MSGIVIGSGLDDYIRKAHSNAAKVLAAGGVWVRMLRQMDTAFEQGGESIKPREGTVVGAFVAGSHSSWLAAANLALSAHLAESFQPLRASLESALYGYRIQADPDAWRKWSRRPSAARMRQPGADQKALMHNRKAVGRDFSATTIAQMLPNHLQPLRERAIDLHEELIDFGAHFNFGVLRRAYRKTGHASDFYSAEIKLLIGREEDRVFCFTKLIQVGICALEVLDAAIGDEWDRQKVQSAVGSVANALRKRPKERLSRRPGAT
jgi:hypothetical protein